MTHQFTTKQDEFIRQNAKGLGNAELTHKFNNYFGIDLKVTQIRAYKKNHKISSGLNGQYKKGSIPFNKGKKGIGGHEPTQFKKGHTPANHREVGSERLNVDGYYEIKVAEPNIWTLKHKVIWEEQNGPLPKGYAIIFGDGNRQNFNIDNLILVTKRQLLILNRKGLIQNDADLTRSAVIIADIYQKITDMKRKAK